MPEEPGTGCPRVAYILKRFPRLSETFIADEIIRLSRMGFDLTIYAIKDPGGPRHPFVQEIECPVNYVPSISRSNFFVFFSAHWKTFTRRPSGYIRCLSYAWSHRSRESKKKFVLAGHLSNAILSRGIQHIHSHFATGSTRLAKYVHLMTGISFSFTAHAKDIFSDRVSVKQLRRRMNLAHFVVTISEYNKRYLESIEPGSRIHVIRNGIRIKEFSQNGRRNSRGENGRPVVLSVGRLVEKKGFRHLVDACAELRRSGVDFRCLIVGDGPLKSELETQIHSLALTEYVSLEGSKTQGELVKNYYRRADIFVLPCVVAGNNDRDGIPVVLEEAMALGIPVITSRVAGIPELVRHLETGILTPPGNAIVLARSIHTLLKNQTLREQVTEAARKLIENEYDIDKTSRNLADLFSGVLVND